ncbi:MAG: hypothetical protein KDJ65_31235 [Anaerolineae bacterium]|nr:hypothetical protein [Anaerolineae bacterium]
MLKKISHTAGVEDTEEILFNTPFGYMFSELANSDDCKLPVGFPTIRALQQLGVAMADPGKPDDPQAEQFDSTIPAVFTYLGQFIDHDITARTDRDEGLNTIADKDGKAHQFTPLAPADVIHTLKNGRRPQYDLDSVYGDGPNMLGHGVPGADTSAGCLYNDDYTMKIQRNGNVDLPREGRKALIADGRNDENVMVSQLHASFLVFHNYVVDHLGGSLSDQVRYITARRLVRWAYQYVVINDFLKQVCDKHVVADVLENGPRFFGPRVSGGPLAMPLEFSVAGFRFGHSLIRPFYRLNEMSQAVEINQLIDVSQEERRIGKDLLVRGPRNQFQLKPEFAIDWQNFAQFEHNTPQKARRIDPRLAMGLLNLPVKNVMPSAVLSHLAQRNLLRGYLLSIPTGQAVAAAMGVVPLTWRELTDGESDDVHEAFAVGGFGQRTPLWYYILKEASVQKEGRSLGVVGSRIVAETLIGLAKEDPISYLNNVHSSAVSKDYHGNPNGIEIGNNVTIETIADILRIATSRVENGYAAITVTANASA